MIGVLAWKTCREQRGIWLAMALLGVVAVVLMMTLVAPNENQGNLLMGALVVIGYIHALVTGAILLAGEREDNTLAFLEHQPMGRLAIWRGKAGMAAVLSAAMALVLALLYLAFGPAAPFTTLATF